MTTKIPAELSSTPGITDSSNATAITIDSSENVGIGTTSGDVRNDGNANRTYVSIIGNANRGVLNLGSTASAGADGGKLTFVNGTNAIGEIYADPDSGSQTNGFMVFSTSNSEKMRIDSSGNLLVGTTAAVSSSRLRVKSSGSSSSEYTCEMGSADGATQLLIRSDGAISLGIDSASPYNNTTGNGANAVLLSNGYLTRSTSSLRYKKDIADATWGLTEVKQLRPVTFKSNSTGEFADDKTYGGLIAEEVHALGLTEFVDYNDDDEPDALHYGNMVSLLTKAIQEQQTLIETLTARIETLEGGE